MKVTRILFLLAVLAVINTVAVAQCKNFAKSSCLPSLSPYLHNGQLNTAMMMAGEQADLKMTFYSGQQYRLMICPQPILGKVSFRILDHNRRPLYDSKNNNYSSTYDFNVASTQDLFIEINVPPQEVKQAVVLSGCVAILLGFKKD